MSIRRSSFLALLLLVVSCFTAAVAQSPESDALFAKGVELYNKGNYEEAASAFSRCQQLDETELQADDSRQGYAKIWLASCYYKLGQEAKAKSLSPEYYRLKPIDRRQTVASDKLSRQASDAYVKGDLASAVPLLRRCAELERQELGEDNAWYANSILILAECLLSVSQDTMEMRSLMEKGLEISREIGYADGEANACRLLGGYHFAMGLYEQAVDSYSRSAAILDSIGSPASAAIARVYAAQNLNLMGRYEESIDILRKSKPIIAADSLAGPQSQVYAVALALESTALSLTGLAQESYDVGLAAEKMLESFSDTLSDYYFFMELNLVEVTRYLNHIEEATQRADKCLAMFDNENYNWRVEFGIFLQSYNVLHYRDFPREKRIGLVRRVRKIFDDAVFMKSNYRYCETLINLASALGEDGHTPEDVAEERSLLVQIDSLLDAGMWIHDIGRVNILELKGNITSESGNLEEALPYLNQALAICDTSKIVQPQYKSLILFKLMTLHTGLGNSYDAFRYAMLNVALCEANGLEKSENYLSSLNSITTYYSGLGDQYNYSLFAEKAEQAARHWGNEMAFGYRNAIINRGNYYITIGESEKGIKLLTEFANLPPSNSDADDGSFISMLFSLINQAIKEKNWNLANSEMSRLDSIVSVNQYAKMFPIAQLMPKALNAFILYYQGDASGAMSALSPLIKEIKAGKYGDVSATGNNFYGIISQMFGLYAVLLEEKGKPSQLADAAIDATESITRSVLDNFKNMTYRERTMFWNNKFAGWFSYNLPRFAYTNRDKRLRSTLYDAVLLSKGILLNSEIEVRKLVEESGSEEAKRLYKKMQDVRVALSKIKQGGGANDSDFKATSDSLALYERLLMEKSKEYGDYTRRLALKWTDVRDALPKDAAAVEFVRTTLKDGTAIYTALIVRPDSDLPRLAYVCSEHDLNGIPSDSLYTSTRLYKLVWQRLHFELIGVKTVYFSPSGRFYNTAIEYAPTGKGTTAAEEMNLVRLSSTRELALRDSGKAQDVAVLYGGLEYDADPQTIAETNHETLKDGQFRDRAVIDETSLRGGVLPLSATLREAEDIGGMIKAAGDSARVLTDLFGTEETLKALSGKRISTLHIATHGFYWTGEAASEQTQDAPGGALSFLMLGNANDASLAEDKVLTRSGLLFAGANTALRHQPVPEGMDDGILTARELSTLDLRGLSLVVLSACQTGLGEVSEEGVFGLQRGFKKAGAQTIMMSLWKVADDATATLMTHFYQGLLGGLSKRQAFLKAQNLLRADSRYSSPRFWAAFVLLDALD